MVGLFYILCILAIACQGHWPYIYVYRAMKPARQENEQMTNLTALINRAAARTTTHYAAQKGIFFDSMDDMIAKVEAEGFSTQQNDGERALVGHKVWMTRHGVITPVNTSNL